MDTKAAIKTLALLAGVVVLGYLAVKISYFAKEGELKVHLREELMQVRKAERLLPLKPDRDLGGICRLHAKRLAEVGKNGALKALKMPKSATEGFEDHFVEVGYMPYGRVTMRASREFLQAATRRSLTRAGFGQFRPRAETGTYYCYLLAGGKTAH